MVKEGERLYGVYCVACHQADGVGKVGTAPYIRNPDFLALASDHFLFYTIVGGRPGTAMVSWSHLKRSEIDSLIAYLRAVEEPGNMAEKTSYDLKHAGDAAEGKDLYAIYCASCHGQNATGYAEGGSGPAIGNAAFLAIASDDFIFQTVMHGRSGTAMRSFKGAGGLANLSELEVGSIIAYLRSDREPISSPNATAGADPKAGEMHFTANCAACHQPDGTGRPGIAPSIRNQDFLAIASDEFIKETVKRGRFGTAMLQRPDLSDKVLDDIIAFLRAVPAGKVEKVEIDPSKQLAAKGDAVLGIGKVRALLCGMSRRKRQGVCRRRLGSPRSGFTGFLM